ncbi:MAG: peptidylprolyl isomerase [Candidatus Marinimicrobia bacterium]|nr:peptidylprolyl isomerase [Candidatus Neomarinimicrobiota bacterium]
MKLISFFFISFLTIIKANDAPVDGLLAVVGNNTILHTDVFQQSQMIAMQQNLDPSQNPFAFERIYNETLSNMIDQYILLAAAEKDTTIEITTNEVDAALEQQLAEIIARAGSEKALEDALGQPIRQIKKDYWVEIKNMILIDRFRYNLFSGVDVTRKEVHSFYTHYKDSLPPAPAKIKFSLIELPFVPSEKSKLTELKLINQLKYQIEGGALFEDIAKEYSQDPGSSNAGGDLGYMKRGTLVSEYEEVAFSLEVNEISEPVLSPFGYHIIQLLDKKGESIHTRHILLFLKPSQEDREIVLEEIRRIYTETQHDPGLFDSLAQEIKYNSKNNSGVYPEIEVNSIPQEVLSSINKTSPYTLSYPFESQNESVYLAYVYNKTDSVKPTLENSWETIKEFAKNEKMNNVFLAWLDENKSKTFVKIFHP